MTEPTTFIAALFAPDPALAIAHWIVAGALLFYLARVIMEDCATCEVRLDHLLIGLVLSATMGMVFPAHGMDWGWSLAGGVMLAGMTLIVRLYAAWRSGHEGLGLADVILVAAGGMVMGPVVAGVWVAVFSLATYLGAHAAPKIMGVRTLEIDGHKAVVMPLCPPIIVTAIPFALLVKTGHLNPHDPLGAVTALGRILP